MGSKAELVSSIQRYLQLQRFSEDQEFLKQLQQVHDWQHQRMCQTYHALLCLENEQKLVRFFLEDIYTGIDLSAIENKLEKAINVADKLFSDLSLIGIALEFNALTGELDELVTTTIFTQMQADKVDGGNYVEALRIAQNREQREHQLELIRQFASGLDETIADPKIFRAFKLAKYPAKLGGLGPLYGLMDRGFSAMLSLQQPEPLINAIIDHEQLIYRNIMGGVADPFAPFADWA